MFEMKQTRPNGSKLSSSLFSACSPIAGLSAALVALAQAGVLGFQASCQENLYCGVRLAGVRFARPSTLLTDQVHRRTWLISSRKFN